MLVATTLFSFFSRAGDGNFEKISVKANTNDFEYSFKFKDDSTDYAKMSLYKLTWTESGLEYENIATYHYAKNDA